jgi:hypothetical protein
MSVLELETPVPAPAGPTWSRVSPTLWVASVQGEFIGTVEQLGDSFVGCDGHAFEVGTFADLEAAKQQVLHPTPPYDSGEGPEIAPGGSKIAWAAACVTGLTLAGAAIAAMGSIS